MAIQILQGLGRPQAKCALIAKAALLLALMVLASGCSGNGDNAYSGYSGPLGHYLADGGG